MKITTKIALTPKEIKEILRNHLMKTGVAGATTPLNIEVLCTQNGMTIHHQSGFTGMVITVTNES